MKSPMTIIFLLVLAAALLTAGCSTVESRISRNRAAFDSFSPAEQELICKGGIDLGFTPGMVLIALGAPDEKRTIRTEGEQREVWVYMTVHAQYAGEVYAGCRPYYLAGPGPRRIRGVFYEPVYTSVYQRRMEERLRVVFVGGRVTGIDQRED